MILGKAPSIFIPSTPTISGAFFLSPSGSDSNPGTYASPFLTLGKAQTAMRSGAYKTTYLAGGTYPLSARLSLTTADNGTSYVAQPGSTPVVDGSAVSLAGFVTTAGVSDLTIKGITWQNCTGSGSTSAFQFASSTGGKIWPAVAAGTTRLAFIGNTLINCGWVGVELVDGAEQCIVSNNTFRNIGAPFASSAGTSTGAAIYAHSTFDCTVEYNDIANCTGAGISFQNFDNATTNSGPPAGSYTVTLRNRIAFNMVVNVNTGSGATDSGGIYCIGRMGLPMGLVIDNNFVDTPGTGGHTLGIYLDDLASGVTVRNNVVRNAFDNCLQYHGGSNCLVYNNIFDMGAAGNPTSGILFQQAPANIGPLPAIVAESLTGNIFYDSHASVPTLFKYFVNSGAAANAAGNPTITKNLYYSSTGQPMTGGVSGITADTAPQTGNPMFVNPAAGNYALASGSAGSLIGFVAINQSIIGLRT